MLTPISKIDQILFMCLVVFRAITRAAKQLQIAGPIGTASAKRDDMIHGVTVANVSTTIDTLTMLVFQHRQNVVTGKSTHSAALPSTVIPNIGRYTFWVPFSELTIIYRHLFGVIAAPSVIAIQLDAWILGISRPMFSKDQITVIFVIAALYFGAMLSIGLPPLAAVFADSFFIGRITQALALGLAFAVISVIAPTFRMLAVFATSSIAVFRVFVTGKFGDGLRNAASGTSFAHVIASACDSLQGSWLGPGRLQMSVFSVISLCPKELYHIRQTEGIPA